MKYIQIVFIALIAALFFSFIGEDPAECDPKGLKDKAKSVLDPYSYDSGKVTRLKTTAKDQVKEIEIPMFIGEKYRVSFNLSALKKNVEINIYNRDKDNSKRKLLFTNKDKFEKEFVFDIAKYRNIYIDYVIPAGTVGEDLGCAVFVLGYK